jgi:hypothetical protein
LQPFQLFSYSGSGNAAIAEAGMQLWQIGSGCSSAVTAQLHHQRSNLQSYQLRQPCSSNQQPCSRAAVQPCSHAALQPCSHAAIMNSLAATTNSLAALQPPQTALQPCSLDYQLCSHAVVINSLAAIPNKVAAMINTLQLHSRDHPALKPKQQLYNLSALQLCTIVPTQSCSSSCSLAAPFNSPTALQSPSTALQAQTINNSLAAQTVIKSLDSFLSG